MAIVGITLVADFFDTFLLGGEDVIHVAIQPRLCPEGSTSAI